MDQELMKRVREAGFSVAHNPIADGNCFYRAAAFELDTDWEILKEMVFDYLESNHVDVSWFYYNCGMILFSCVGLFFFNSSYYYYLLSEFVNN